MKLFRQFLAVLVFTTFYVAAIISVAHAQGYTVHDDRFTDTNRDRTIPYKLYAPANATTPAPVVIFSHGLGGSTEAAPYLGQALAQNGYYAFFIQHPGSDSSIWKGKATNRAEAMKFVTKGTKDIGAAMDRYKDLPFVIDSITTLNNQSSALKGKLDLSRIGMAGHSYGARSVMAAAGESAGRFGAPFKDPRIKAGIALSPNLSQRYLKHPPTGDISHIYDQIDIPVFHITGTKDGFLGQKDFDPATRTLPYKYTKATNQYLLVMDGAEHKDFGGRKSDTTLSRYQQATAQGAVLFFDAYLKGDQNALSALRSNYKNSLSPQDLFTFK